MSKLEILKIELREEEIPYFTDADLTYYLDKNKNNVNSTLYECLIIKSENTSLNANGMSTTDTSSYFKRLASRYKPSNSRILGD